MTVLSEENQKVLFKIVSSVKLKRVKMQRDFLFSIFWMAGQKFRQTKDFPVLMLPILTLGMSVFSEWTQIPTSNP